MILNEFFESNSGKGTNENKPEPTAGSWQDIWKQNPDIKNPKQAVPEDVTETSDYFRRREREEAIISGQKPARKKQPTQTSDYARRREQEKKAEKGVAEGMEGRVVFSGTGANGSKYEIIQTGPTDFMIHANGRHIDTYSSLQRAMGVLKNEVPGLQQGVAEGSSCNMTMEGKSCPMHGLKECPGYKSNIEETTAGSVATVVNPTPKNKAKVGTLFGGTYKQKKTK